MASALSSLDWTLVQSFLAVADSGSLSEAARQLGTSQSTVGRHIRQIEDALEATLFHRQPRGLGLTEVGRALLPHARAMAEGAHALRLAAAGKSDRLAGPVRITASVFAAHHHLPPILAELRRDEPEISIDLVPSDQSENLLYREADIAVRMYRTEQLDIVTRHICDLGIGLYAARAYLDRVGRPRGLDQVLKLDLVGFDRDDEILRGMRELGIAAQRDWFATRCDHNTVYWELVQAGCGAGFVVSTVADKCPGVERIEVDFPLPKLSVWLATHEAMRSTPRIRRVWDALAEGLIAQVS
ncbi:LysR family transcriptional regulator [Aestuariicoccus sp. MJ-SS9]|uniref:LysR family transcriptional regulator n=1 Tax=Aestuariicoccus sp. MJ-SS9 TaxID=3079855 RepID=UPI00290FABF6|nr:LysR family transcriptional regulator [Aestuariicoccus sp. MJ-SS9]MDU8913567.1 LysR family transcriptional regulator [Aestuariicoccus sp. MJ-SS9]